MVNRHLNQGRMIKLLLWTVRHIGPAPRYNGSYPRDETNDQHQ